MIDRGCLESHHDATPEQKQLIFDDFNRFKKDHCEDIETDFKFHYLTPQGRLEPLILGSEELAVAHNEAFASAFEKANCMIEEASARSKKARVIVTGWFL
jgi:hypothetical protein